ncbi:MAG: 4'-phosphopantetheinyl transferase superfamily protein, partial [Planctomycetota bacterium]|nr:4'-phosphopantetheinyl transferase superfamily protein [Planctomycetota bacterium]
MTDVAAAKHDLPPGGVDLWYTPVEKACDEPLLSRYRALLTVDETQRARRFVFEKHRHQYLVTRGLVRTTLSHYFDVEPCDWVFVQDQFGKPHVAGPIELPLAFNLSHTEGLVICGVAALPMLGVDVERIDRDTETLTIAKRFFAEPEFEYLHSVDKADRRETFFQIWTLKEAYIKARGKGFHLPLGDFAFHFAPGTPAVISFLADLQDDPSVWQF